ncbi:MAG TPA: Crp/Fnr family transcriptional regulator [Burkholderiales bacterium]|nr:Crp/Fnr family transcriptional regulator [Burkholderiales bacterium]
MSRNQQPSSLGLKGIGLLDGLATGRLDALARECAWRNYAPGQQIISREADDRDLYLIVSGRVRVTIYSAGGRQVTFRDLGAGESFGDVAAIDGKRRSADVVALEASLLAALPSGAFWRLLREEPLVTERVLQRLANLVRELSERVIDLSTVGVQNRIHAEVLRLAREAGAAGNTARIDPAPKHADIASRVSTYREQVTRELSALVKMGIVERGDHALVICDLARLARLVEEVRGAA